MGLCYHPDKKRYAQLWQARGAVKSLAKAKQRLVHVYTCGGLQRPHYHIATTKG